MGQEWETETRSVPENPTDFEALTPAPPEYSPDYGKSTIIIWIILIAILVGFFVANTYEYRSPDEERYWVKYATRDAYWTGADNDEALTDKLAFVWLEVIQRKNPNAVCPYGDDRGAHVDTLIQRFKRRVAEHDVWRSVRDSDAWADDPREEDPGKGGL